MIQITTTGDDRAELESIAKHLVEHGLAACCQIEGPITSIYRWAGKLETSDEYRCIVKSTRERYPQIEAAILSLHHYDQPQIVATDLAFVEQGYARWIRESVTPSEG